MRKGQFSIILISLLFLNTGIVRSQNLVVDGTISSSNTNWGGGTSESPYNSGTFESTYLSTGCNSNYVMEADYESQPTQTVTGFEMVLNTELVSDMDGGTPDVIHRSIQLI
jgi:hypothetical protein